MISLSRSRRVIVAVLCLPILLADCTLEPEAEMTPEQTRQIFVTETKVIIQAVFPDVEPRVIVIDQDGPCGGPVGTEFSSVESTYSIHGRAPDDTLNPDEVFRKVLDVLKQRGWTINYSHERRAGAERKGVGGIRAGVGGSPLGINILGRTECVENPEE